MVMCRTLFVITVASQEEFLMTFLFLWFVMWSPDNALVLCMLLKKSWCSMFVFRTMLSRITTSSLNAARGFSTSVARWKNLKCRIYSNFCSGEEATGCLPLGTICHSPSTTGLYFWISSTFWRFLPTQVQAHCLLHRLLWLRPHHPLLCHETPAA